MNYNTADKKIVPNNIVNKFGQFDISMTTIVSLPFGLIGIPELKQYYLIRNFSAKMPNFSLLQSVEKEVIVFLLYNQSVNDSMINKIDITSSCMLVGIKKEELDLFLIASVRKTDKGTSITLNTKAPLFINNKQNIGIQYVLQSNAYTIQYLLNNINTN